MNRTEAELEAYKLAAENAVTRMQQAEAAVGRVKALCADKGPGGYMDATVRVWEVMHAINWGGKEEGSSPSSGGGSP